MSITRRDFINGTSIAVVAGLSPIDILNAKSGSNYYPPSLTGMRGNHTGSFENAHLLGREGKDFQIDNLPIKENYDCVVVGAGISGLSAARFYQNKYGENSKILIIDNHDDFGGHAKRNEFKVNGKFILTYGGTESLQSPKHIYSQNALSLLRDIAVDIDELGKCFNQSFYPKMKLSRGVFFDKETFGQDKIVSGDPFRTVADDIDPKELNGKKIEDFFTEFPLPKSDKKSLIELYKNPINYLPGKNDKETEEYLSKISYKDFLLKNVNLSSLAVEYFFGKCKDFCAFAIDLLPAFDARSIGLPGFDKLNLPPLDAEELAELNDPYIYHFPDGNASLARLLVRKMIPNVAIGNSMHDIVLAKFDYSKLDLPQNLVRLRLNTTVVVAKNLGHGAVDIGYVNRNGKIQRVNCRHAIMAGYNMMIPYIVKDIELNQKKALSSNVKSCMVYSKVIIRNWRSFVKLGVHEVYCPKMPYVRVKLDYPVNIGGYKHPKNVDEPMCLHMTYIPIDVNSKLDVRSAFRVARYKLLTRPFAEFEKEIRNQLQRMFGPAGFQHDKDILAITVNRWSHGYSYEYNSLFDNYNDTEKMIEQSQHKHGNIVIANSDSSWSPYTHTAIDMAHRAVGQF